VRNEVVQGKVESMGSQFAQRVMICPWFQVPDEGEHDLAAGELRDQVKFKRVGGQADEKQARRQGAGGYPG